MVVFATQWGWCAVAATGTAVTQVILPQPNREAVVGRREDQPAAGQMAQAAAEQLAEYFQQRRREFTVPVDISTLPPFTRQVLSACATIPWGDTRAYGQLAAQVGCPRGARAVGQALGRNPVPILIPCHRVISSDGSLGGFGAGMEMKRRLLELEGVTL